MNTQIFMERTSKHRTRFAAVSFAVLMTLFALFLAPSEIWAYQIGGATPGINEAQSIHTALQWAGGWIRTGRWVLLAVALGVGFWKGLSLLFGNKKNGVSIGVVIGCAIAAFMITFPRTTLKILGFGNYTCVVDMALKPNYSQAQVQNCLNTLSNLESS